MAVEFDVFCSPVITSMRLLLLSPLWYFDCPDGLDWLGGLFRYQSACLIYISFTLANLFKTGLKESCFPDYSEALLVVLVFKNVGKSRAGKGSEIKN